MPKLIARQLHASSWSELVYPVARVTAPDVDHTRRPRANVAPQREWSWLPGLRQTSSRERAASPLRRCTCPCRRCLPVAITGEPSALCGLRERPSVRTWCMASSAASIHLACSTHWLHAGSSRLSTPSGLLDSVGSSSDPGLGRGFVGRARAGAWQPDRSPEGQLGLASRALSKTRARCFPP